MITTLTEVILLQSSNRPISHKKIIENISPKTVNVHRRNCSPTAIDCKKENNVNYTYIEENSRLLWGKSCPSETWPLWGRPIRGGKCADWRRRSMWSWSCCWTRSGLEASGASRRRGSTGCTTPWPPPPPAPR